MNSVHWNAERGGPIPSDKVISSAAESTASDTDGPPGPLGAGRRRTSPGLHGNPPASKQTTSFKDVHNDAVFYAHIRI